MVLVFIPSKTDVIKPIFVTYLKFINLMKVGIDGYIWKHFQKWFYVF